MLYAWTEKLFHFVSLAFTSAYPCLWTKLSECCDSRRGNSVQVILGILKINFSFPRPKLYLNILISHIIFPNVKLKGKEAKDKI